MIPAPLLVVTDRHGARRPLVDSVRAVLDGGGRWVWLRDRDLEPGARRELAEELLLLVREAGGRLTIGGDAGLTAEIGADGLHLSGSVFDRTDPIQRRDEASDPARIPSPRTRGEGFGDLVVAEARRQPRVRGRGRQGLFRNRPLTSASASPPLPAWTTRSMQASPRLWGEGGAAANAIAEGRLRLGANALIGLSAHSLADVRAAARAGADYVTLSPIFASASKPGYGPALGLDALRAASEIGIPVVALGGIGVAQALSCRDAGAAGIAVMGGLMRAPDPAGETRRLLDALGERSEPGAQVKCAPAHGAPTQGV